MPNPSMLDQDNTARPDSQTTNEPNESSFGDLLSQFEQSHHKKEEGAIDGTVVAISSDSVFVDVGYKTEGILPLADFQTAGETVKRGQQIATVGTANGRYFAHLHFEMREFLTPFIGPGYREDTRGWINPTKFIEAHR